MTPASATSSTAKTSPDPTASGDRRRARSHSSRPRSVPFFANVEGSVRCALTSLHIARVRGRKFPLGEPHDPLKRCDQLSASRHRITPVRRRQPYAASRARHLDVAALASPFQRTRHRRDEPDRASQIVARHVSLEVRRNITPPRQPRRSRRLHSRAVARAARDAARHHRGRRPCSGPTEPSPLDSDTAEQLVRRLTRPTGNHGRYRDHRAASHAVRPGCSAR